MDRAKVIDALEHCMGYSFCDDCPYDGKCSNEAEALNKDILALLREQEPVEPHVEHDSDDDTWYYGCGACHEAIDHKDKFCRHCGREVKWG